MLRGGFYAIPALCGATIVVVAYRAGDHTIIFPIVGAVVCFLMRIAGLRYGLGLPGAADIADIAQARQPWLPWPGEPAPAGPAPGEPAPAGPAPAAPTSGVEEGDGGDG